MTFDNKVKEVRNLDIVDQAVELSLAGFGQRIHVCSTITEDWDRFGNDIEARFEVHLIDGGDDGLGDEAFTTFRVWSPGAAERLCSKIAWKSGIEIGDINLDVR